MQLYVTTNYDLFHLYLGASTSYQRSNLNSLQAGSKLAGHLADEQVVCMHVY